MHRTCAVNTVTRGPPPALCIDSSRLPLSPGPSRPWQGRLASMSKEIEAAAAERVATQHIALQHSTTRCNTAHHVAAQYTVGSACSYERWVSKQRQAREHDAAVAAQVPTPLRTTVQYRRLHTAYSTASPARGYPRITRGACRGVSHRKGSRPPGRWYPVVSGNSPSSSAGRVCEAQCSCASLFQAVPLRRFPT